MPLKEYLALRWFIWQRSREMRWHDPALHIGEACTCGQAHNKSQHMSRFLRFCKRGARTPFYGIHLTSDYAVNSIRFSTATTLGDVDELMETAEFLIIENKLLWEKLEQNKLRSARHEILTRAVQNVADVNDKELAQYPSVISDIARFLLGRIEGRIGRGNDL